MTTTQASADTPPAALKARPPRAGTMSTEMTDSNDPPSPRLELAMALLPFALLSDEGYDSQVVVRIEATAGEIRVARETIEKHFPGLLDGAPVADPDSRRNDTIEQQPSGEREKAMREAAAVAEQYREEAGGSHSYQQACQHIASTILALIDQPEGGHS